MLDKCVQRLVCDVTDMHRAKISWKANVFVKTRAILKRASFRVGAVGVYIRFEHAILVDD